MSRKLLLLAFVAAVAAAQTSRLDPEQAVAVRLGDSASLQLVSKDLTGTEISPRGGAVVIDLRARLQLRNAGSKPLRGAAFRVVAGERSAGGSAVVYAPSLSVAAGETFPVELSVRLLRPLPSGSGPLVEIASDGVLFADLTLAGSAKRLLTFEMEARRDRERLRTILSQGGQERLRAEALQTLERQSREPTLQARLAGGSGRAVADASSGRRIELAALNFDSAPLEIVSGSSWVSDSSAQSPIVEALNRSRKTIRSFEIGWVVSTPTGERLLAAVAPSAAGEAAPGAATTAPAGRRFELSTARGEPVALSGMSGYVRRVEFNDGEVWTPSPADLASRDLLWLEPVSAEQQRLAAIYQRFGVAALVAELEKF